MAEHGAGPFPATTPEQLEIQVRDWEELGERIDGPSGPVWCARWSAARDVGNPPLLALHGFPTNACDWQPVLGALRQERDVVVLDVTGFGLSAKPDHRYSIRGYADDAAAVIAHFGLDRIDLLTHDMGDTVGGELLARVLEGSLELDVRRRVVTNGSIYIGMAEFTLGQQLLLGLPDAAEPAVGADGGATFRQGVAATFSPETELDHAGEAHLDTVVALSVREDGLATLPRTIRYIEDRQAEERRFTGAIERHPSPVGLVWGADDPVAVHAMTDTFLAARPDAPRTTLDGVGHYPMIEAPERFASAVLDLLDRQLA